MIDRKHEKLQKYTPLSERVEKAALRALNGKAGQAKISGLHKKRMNEGYGIKDELSAETQQLLEEQLDSKYFHRNVAAAATVLLKQMDLNHLLTVRIVERQSSGNFDGNGGSKFVSMSICRKCTLKKSWQRNASDGFIVQTEELE